jgi:hypothetical protein
LLDPFKEGADWLVAKLVGGLLEVETEVCGDVLMGGRIGRVGVVDVEETAGDDEDELKILAVGFVPNVVDGGAPNGCPGEKACALGLSTVAEVEAVRLMSDTLPGNPDGALCEAAKREDDGASTAAAGAGDDVDGIVDLLNGDPKIDAVAFSPTFGTTGADVDAAKGEKDVSAEPEALGTEEVDDPKAEAPPNAEEEEPPPKAGLAPKLRLPPNTFGVVLRFANAEAAGGMEGGAEGAAVSSVGIEAVPKAEATGAGAADDDVPNTEVVDDELVAPSMTEGEGRTPKVPVSHSVALGFSGLGSCCGSAGSSGSSIIGWSSRKKASSSS